MKYFIVLFVLLSKVCFANNLIENTAIVALKTAKHSSTGTTLEHGGMIFQRGNDQYGPLIEFLEPYPAGKFDGVIVIKKDLLLPGDKLLATYHIHLCMKGYYHDLFSAQDVVMAILLGLPEFMLDECTGNVYEFDPLVDKIHDTGKEASLFGFNCEKVIKHLPSGRIIGNIGETEILMDPPAPPSDGCTK